MAENADVVLLCVYVFSGMCCGIASDICSIVSSQDMIKHSSTTDHKGNLKEYFDQLNVSINTRCVYICLHTGTYVSVSRGVCVYTPPLVTAKNCLSNHM